MSYKTEVAYPCSRSSAQKESDLLPLDFFPALGLFNSEKGIAMRTKVL